MISYFHGTPNLMRVVIQNPVLDGSEGGPAGDEWGSPGRPLLAAGDSAEPCAPLARLFPRLSPAEGRRPHTFSSLQEEDVGAT